MTDEPAVSDHALELRALVAACETVPIRHGEFDDGFLVVIELLGKPVIVTVLGAGQRPKHNRFATRLIRIPAEMANRDG